MWCKGSTLCLGRRGDVRIVHFGPIQLLNKLTNFLKYDIIFIENPNVAQLVEAMDMRLKDIDWGSTNISYH